MSRDSLLVIKAREHLRKQTSNNNQKKIIFNKRCAWILGEQENHSPLAREVHLSSRPNLRSLLLCLHLMSLRGDRQVFRGRCYLSAAALPAPAGAVLPAAAF